MQDQILEQGYTQELLLQAAQEIFHTMVFLDVQAAPDTTNPVTAEALLGTITFFGDGIEGAFSFRSHNACGIAITGHMLGDETPGGYSSEEVDDTIREICNMTMGCIKGAAIGRFGNVQVSIPTVTRGHDIEQSLGENLQSLILPVLLGDTFPAELSLQWRESSA